ncbi:putative ATP-dependent RNA helicase ddx4 [Parelaphostrongylus tenuis]|uniref:RNA helicase n=1 Tax=Parelaphostrongylus tenuis TaxID=148309 RepID=A0AAD5WIY0_PARTN|nr:putative ATP-dependent RNA helicase ddx4 [Parelaphostrongylus tenuis]
MDYIEKGDIDVSTLRFLVLDEADMLLEDGGQHHIRSIFSNPSFPKVESRQTLLFSATFPDDVEKLARDIMKEKYVKISNGTQKRANTRVKQLFEKVRGTSGKNEKLFEILENQRDSQAKDGSVVRTLVFVGTKKQADFIALLLSQKNVKAGSINSNRPQNERERVVKELRDGSIHVLIGTDVCQRGLDIHGLDHVINYDLPSGPPKEIATKYIHRIGRTGRLHGGISTTFVDTAHATDTTIQLIVNVAKESGQEIPVWLEEMCGIDRCGGNRSFYANGAVDSGDSTWPAHEDDLGELGTDGFNCDVARSTNRSDEQKETIEDDGDW